MATIGRVVVKSPNRTTIADPNFRPKPNVALTELTDTDITSVEDGQVLTWDATAGKFVADKISQSQVTIEIINGGAF